MTFRCPSRSNYFTNEGYIGIEDIHSRFYRELRYSKTEFFLAVYLIFVHFSRPMSNYTAGCNYNMSNIKDFNNSIIFYSEILEVLKTPVKPGTGKQRQRPSNRDRRPPLHGRPLSGASENVALATKIGLHSRSTTSLIFNILFLYLSALCAIYIYCVCLYNFFS